MKPLKFTIIVAMAVLLTNHRLLKAQGNTWKLFGNNNVTTNSFIGVTNPDSDFIFKTNSLERMRITSDGKIIFAPGVSLTVPNGGMFDSLFANFISTSTLFSNTITAKGTLFADDISVNQMLETTDLNVMGKLTTDSMKINTNLLIEQDAHVKGVLRIGEGTLNIFGVPHIITSTSGVLLFGRGQIPSGAFVPKGEIKVGIGISPIKVLTKALTIGTFHASPVEPSIGHSGIRLEDQLDPNPQISGDETTTTWDIEPIAGPLQQKLYIGTPGNQMMVFSDTGKVDINVPLNVNGDISASGVLKSGNSITINGALTGTGDNDRIIASSGNLSIRKFENSVGQIKLGVGEINPKKGIHLTTVHSIEFPSPNGEPPHAGIRLEDRFFDRRTPGGDDTTIWDIEPNASEHKLFIGPPNNPIMTLTEDGNIGFNEESPTSLLHLLAPAIQFENLFRAEVEDAPDDFFAIRNTTGNTGQFIPTLWGHHQTNTRQALFLLGEITATTDAGTSPVMTFDARREGAEVQNRPLFSWASFGNTKMTLLANGNLDVCGTIRGKKLIAQTGNWCDYVFYKDYPLISLYNLEQYILKYGHLPGILSAKEIEENDNSYDLGEMSEKLLVKIEELTLYIIELQKQIEQLKKGNEELENSLSSSEVQKLLLEKISELTQAMIQLQEENQKLMARVSQLENKL